MTTPVTATTLGKTTFAHATEAGHPLFRIEPGIPCSEAREQASELLECVSRLNYLGVMEHDDRLTWAAYYLGAMAKALLDDAELGMQPV